MTSTTLDWKTDEKLAVGKGATVQQFVASLGGNKFEIDVAPWGEGHLKVNGREIAHVDDAKDRRQAFRTFASSRRPLSTIYTGTETYPQTKGPRP